MSEENIVNLGSCYTLPLKLFFWQVMRRAWCLHLSQGGNVVTSALISQVKSHQIDSKSEIPNSLENVESI